MRRRGGRLRKGATPVARLVGREDQGGDKHGHHVNDLLSRNGTYPSYGSTTQPSSKTLPRDLRDGTRFCPLFTLAWGPPCGGNPGSRAGLASYTRLLWPSDVG